MYELYSTIYPEVYPPIKQDTSIFNQDSRKDEEYPNISEETRFSPSATEPFFPAAWMSEKNDFFNCPASDWVEFPIGHTLENYLGTEQAALIRSAPEFQMNEKLFRKLNNGDLTDMLNQHIPGPAGPIRMAQPLSKLPKSIIYNMKHHGSLQIDLARGQRQQYDVQSATGKKFVIGATSTYYTHDRSVVNLRTYAETHDVFKMYVHSSATHHFACKAPLPDDFSKRPPTKSSVVYRYEGDFRIEQVTVQDPTNEAQYKGLVDQYIQGIHASLTSRAKASPSLTIQSPDLFLIGENPRHYGTAGGPKKSVINLLPTAVIIGVRPTGEAFFGIRIVSECLILKHNLIKLNGRIEANYPADFRKEVTIDPSAKLACTEITNLERLNGRNIAIQADNLIIQ